MDFVWCYDSNSNVGTTNENNLHSRLIFCNLDLLLQVATTTLRISLQVIGAVSELEHGVYCVDYCPAVGAVAVTTGTELHVAIPDSRLPVFITQED